MKFGNQSRSSLLIINMIFEIANLDIKNYFGRFGLKIAIPQITTSQGLTEINRANSLAN